MLFRSRLVTLFFAATLTIIAATSPSLHAQVVIDNGLDTNVTNTTVNDLVIVADDPNPPNNPTTLTVEDPAFIIGDGFDDSLWAVENSIINITGGTIQEDVVSFDNSRINMSGGIAQDDFFAQDNSVVTFSGGTVAEDLNLFDDARVIVNSGQASGSDTELANRSSLTINGGVIGDNVTAFNRSFVTMHGGRIVDDLELIGPNTSALITGGEIGQDIEVLGGEITITGGILGTQGVFDSGFASDNGAVITLVGLMFEIDGVPVSHPTEVNPLTGFLSGTLSDGNSFSDIPFVRGFFGGGPLPEVPGRILLVPEPSRALLLLLAFTLTLLPRHRRRPSSYS
ncbi:MAG: hypothetical protein AAF591_23290 [Verrucomicrobiota bacterium]